MAADGLVFERLVELVLDDPALCRRLLATTDRRTFTLAVAEIAGSHGLEVGPADVESALVSARRAWFERWV